MIDEGQEDLQEKKQAAEYNAYSVRQLIAQRSRLFEAFKVAGQVAEFSDKLVNQASSEMLLSPPGQPAQRDGASRLAKVFEAIELTQSEFMQDIFCLLLNGGKTDGFFVEFGACDGRLISNTWLLENKFGWNGILAEPARSWHARLKQNRNCIVDHRCVWAETGKNLEFAEFSDDDYGTQSTILMSASDKRPLVSERYEVETVSLFDLLRQHNAPDLIDLISIDTEGSEYEIIKEFPFDKYQFGFMCVEHLKSGQEEQLRDFLKGVGYQQILKSVSGYDGFFVPATLSLNI